MKTIYRSFISLILATVLLSSLSCGQSGDKPIILQVTAPTNLVATASGSYKIDLVWIDNSNNETNFAISRSILPDSGFAVISSTIAAGATAYSDTTVVPSTTYYYKVYAYNTNTRSSDSNVATASTLNDNTSNPVLSEFDAVPASASTFEHELQIENGKTYSLVFYGENFVSDSKVVFVLNSVETELINSSILILPNDPDKLTLSNVPTSFFTALGDYSVYIKNDDNHKSQSMTLTVAWKPIPFVIDSNTSPYSDCSRTTETLSGLPNGTYKIYLNPTIYYDPTPGFIDEERYPAQNSGEDYGFNFRFQTTAQSSNFYLDGATVLGTMRDAYNVYVATNRQIQIEITDGTLIGRFYDFADNNCYDNHGSGYFLVQRIQ